MSVVNCNTNNYIRLLYQTESPDYNSQTILLQKYHHWKSRKFYAGFDTVVVNPSRFPITNKTRQTIRGEQCVVFSKKFNDATTVDLFSWNNAKLVVIISVPFKKIYGVLFWLDKY